MAYLLPTSTRKLRAVLLAMFLAFGFYAGFYAINSYYGGYWAKAERDGRDKHSFGLSLHTAVLWQPRFGYWTPYVSDWLGAFYSPLIRLDRSFVHPTRYLSDSSFESWWKSTSASDWHPTCRDAVQKMKKESPKSQSPE